MKFFNFSKGNFNTKSFMHILVSNFNLCFFVSLIILTLLPNPELFMLRNPGQKWFLYMLIPAINGTLTMLITLGLNRYFAKKNYTRKYYTQDTNALMLVAFLAGFLSLYITYASIFTYLISLIIIYIAFLNVRSFASQITTLLEPDKMATAEDLAEFANFFITLIITFAVVNLSINTIHTSFNAGAAFNFGSGITGIINALYFSIITMTTVGYGHIIPNSAIARIAVSFECLTSYITLGIMIGIICRGVNFTKKP